MLRIAVCDDEALHCAYAAQMIRTHPECPDAEIRQFLSPQELLNALENETFLADIAVVDICMEERRFSMAFCSAGIRRVFICSLSTK